MKLTIEYKTQIKSAAGIAREDIELEGDCTLKAAVQHVAQKHGDPLKKMLLDPEGHLQKAILLFLKDQHINWSDSPELTDGDVITLFSPISGG